MDLIKNDVVEASKQIGLTDSQSEHLWQALQEIQAKKSTYRFSAALLYFGGLIAILSMTWFYTAHLKSSYSLLISIVYSWIFFSAGSYIWRTKKLRVPGGLLCSLGIVMIPLIIYSLQKIMGWQSVTLPNQYKDFYYWINSSWVLMEICTLAVACFVFYFIRFPFITVLIYLILTFMCMDVVRLFIDSHHKQWLYYCSACIAMGGMLNIQAFILCRKDKKDFGFWSYFFGLFLIWSGLISWDIKTEWGYFFYFLINLTFVLLSNYFHRRIFLFFGSLGVIYYLSHLAYVFSDALMFSYVIGAIGFSIIMLATFLMRRKKSVEDIYTQTH